MTSSTKTKRIIASFFLLLFCTQILAPTASYALTGGPSQPEVESFSPVGTSDMVDLFTGDFKYNIPLLDVGGYPINLVYNAGSNMEQEASWVGLGWNINPGAINRNLRGLPDDANGDIVKTKIYQKPNWTAGLGGSALVKALGFKTFSTSASVGLTLNNYTGFGFDLSFNVRKQANKEEKEEGEVGPKKKQSNLNAQIEKLGSTLGVNKPLHSVVQSLYPELNFPIGKGSFTFSNIRNYVNSISEGRSFAYKSYTPSVNMAFKNVDFKVGLAFGNASVGIFGSPSIYGSFSRQALALEYYEKPAYGFLYHWDKSNDDVLLDINRERDGVYYKGKPYLPLPISTYDLYSISGQGVSGQIKPFRNAIDVYSDDNHRSTSASIGADLEFGVTSDMHTKTAVNVQVSSNSSGKWHSNLVDHIETKTKAFNHPQFEQTYFKTVGEFTPSNTNLIVNSSQGILAPKVQRDFLEVNSPQLLKEVGNSTTEHPLTNSETGNMFSKNRTSRNQLISYKTFDMLGSFVEPNINPSSIIRPIPIYVNALKTITPSSIPAATNILNSSGVVPSDGSRKSKHIGEFTVTKNDGSRYVYGVAAYNNWQNEVVFTTANNNQRNSNNGNVDYGTGGASFLETLTKGVDMKRSDRFYKSVSTPSYAHSYLLSSILGTDYFDILPKGIGPEDLGNYTKFEYARTATNFKWRHPYNKNEAIYSEGTLSEQFDNKASYTEGSKEIWHLQTIRTKKYVAVFFIDERMDGKDVDKENKSFQLSRISLYDREQYDVSANPMREVEPIKTIWFEYDYSLCQNIENTTATQAGEKGKLTLKEVYFTYGNSLKKFNSYKFNYASKNPSYRSLDVDRWGNYQEGPSSADGFNNGFPYTKQNKLVADENASAWNLTEIKLPSGGSIKINYEADDYAYVQDKRATQMMEVKGVGSFSQYSPLNKLYSGDINFNYLYFDIPNESERSGLTEAEYVNQSLDVGGVILFKVLANIADVNTVRKEWITGYGEVESYGICPQPAVPIAPHFYVKLKEKSLESLTSRRKISPITKACFTFTKDNLQHLVDPGYADMIADKVDINPMEVFYKLLAVGDISSKLLGTNQKLLERSWGQEITLGKSWVRLANPFKSKLGGGHRVKSLVFSDNWLEATSNLVTNSVNTQSYFYHLTETIERASGKFQRKISSGVASFEPSTGAEENSLKLPIDVTKAIKILPDEERYEDGPVGESYYPAPSVGYSKVTIETTGSLNNTMQNGTPNSPVISGSKKSPSKTVNEFYTAKDFPVRVTYTAIQPAIIEPPVIDMLIFSYTYKNVGVSQGYSIELNDMHGKPKAVFDYTSDANGDETKDKLNSYTKYYYKTDPGNPSQLNNDVKVIEPGSKAIVTKSIGVEKELILDSRQKQDKFHASALQLNWTTLMTCYGLTLPSFYPDYGITKDYFYSTTALTVKNSYGILEKTEAYVDGSNILSENLAYDAQTGEVLVTKTTDEYNEAKYQTTYPAHWQYDGMGQGYKNIGIEIAQCYSDANGKLGQVVSSGITYPMPSLAMVNAYLVDGDEVWVDIGGFSRRCYISKQGADFYIYYQDNNSPATGNYGKLLPLPALGFTLKVIRSGRVNMQSIPIQNTVSLENPASGSVLAMNASNKILDAKANTFMNQNFRYKTFSETVNTSDPVFKLSEVLNVISYLLANINYTVTASMLANPQSQYSTVAIPSSILTTNNIYTNSQIYKERRLNGYPVDDFTLNFVPAKSNAYGEFNIQFNYGGPSTLLFENRWEYISNSQLLDKRILGIDYVLSSLNSNTTNSSNKVYNLGAISLIDNTTTSTFPTIGGHVYMDINKFSSSFQLVADDHLKSPNYTLDRIGPNWHAQTSYVYKTNREYAANIPVGRTGAYIDYSELFSGNGSITPGQKWKSAEETMLFDPYTGAELESKDALNRYRSIRYNRNATSTRSVWYNQETLYLSADRSIDLQPSIYADNARLAQITAFNFEYQDEITPATFSDRHFFNGGERSNSFSHSGDFSVKVSGESVFKTLISRAYSNDASLANSILPFYPEPGQYTLSAWVRYNKPFYATDKNDARCVVQVLTDNNDLIGVPVVFKPSGEIIDGWQRIVGTFTINAGTGTIVPKFLRVKLVSGSNSNSYGTYFDDVRIAPYNAALKNYVYDSKKRVSAVLDENNYATFYQYDIKGEVVSVKKETSKGVLTIMESRKINPVAQ